MSNTTISRETATAYVLDFLGDDHAEFNVEDIVTEYFNMVGTYDFASAYAESSQNKVYLSNATSGNWRYSDTPELTVDDSYWYYGEY